jgi:lipooligosaccharide transport system permease protein
MATPSAHGAPTTTGLVVRQADHWWARWRRTWRGSAITNFVLPVLYLLAMGVGLGAYIDDGGATSSLGTADSWTSSHLGCWPRR